MKKYTVRDKIFGDCAKRASRMRDRIRLLEWRACRLRINMVVTTRKARQVDPALVFVDLRQRHLTLS